MARKGSRDARPPGSDPEGSPHRAVPEAICDALLGCSFAAAARLCGSPAHTSVELDTVGGLRVSLVWQTSDPRGEMLPDLYITSKPPLDGSPTSTAESAMTDGAGRALMVSTEAHPIHGTSATLVHSCDASWRLALLSEAAEVPSTSAGEGRWDVFARLLAWLELHLGLLGVEVTPDDHALLRGSRGR